MLLALLVSALWATPSVAAAPSSWDDAYTQAASLLSQMSAADKVNLVTGVGWKKGPCVGNTQAISSISYPQLCLQDGPLGVRLAAGVTAFTPGIQAASTWDLDLMNQRGAYMAAEFKACGVHVLLGPVAGPLGKNPQGGRNWEGFGPDPYLTGMAMAATINGIQGAGVQACAKHFIGNEQELNRESMSSNIDDRTMHELYLWPFADAVHADVASVMCSYNKLDSTYSCENSKALTTLLKTEMGFRGYVVTDWGAHHTTAGAATAGTDMSMPGSDFNGNNVLWGDQLTDAIQGGQVPQARVDDMATRILASWVLTGQNAGDYPSVNFAGDVQGNHKDNVRAVARDGIVLLKNDGGVLPLNKPAKMAVVGSAAVVNPAGINACQDRACNTGALGMGWGSGTAEYPYVVAPLDALTARAQNDGTALTTSTTDDPAGVAGVVSGADVALVFVTADSGEGYLTVEGNAGDRNNLDPWHNGNALVAAVAAAVTGSTSVIVVVHSGGPVILESILAVPAVKAVVWAGLPAQENGNALVDILYGAVSPNGKLPYTIGKSAADYGAAPAGGDDSFAEGLNIDYRYFDANGIEPRFEFGFGLSYTTFTYSDLQTTTATTTSGPASGDTIPGGRADLFDTVATVTATITNTGSVDGPEVAQLYITLPSSAPSSPPRQLRGFAKLSLAAGAGGTATFNLRRKDLSYWDGASQNWILPAGSFEVNVGASSRDLRLKGTLEF